MIRYLITLELLRLCSLPTALRCLRGLGWLKHATHRHERRQAEDWAAEFLPGSTTTSERDAFIRRHVTHSVVYAHLTPLILSHDAARYADLLNVEGWEHVEEALRLGRGCVLLNTHLGMPRLLRWHLRTRGHPVLNLMTMGLPEYPADSWRGRLRAWHRRRYHMDDETTLGHGGVAIRYLKPAFHHLERNGIVCIGGDTSSTGDGSPTSIEIRGRRIQVGIGGLSLSLMTGAPIIPFFTILGHAPEFQVMLQSPLQPGAGPGRNARLAAMLADYGHRIEQQIERFPDNVLRTKFLKKPAGRSVPNGLAPRPEADRGTTPHRGMIP